MEGQFCDGGDCSICRQSEWSLATYLGREKTNSVFKQRKYHIFDVQSLCRDTLLGTVDWESWLTQEDVNGMVSAGLNSIRIPLGFWIVEDIVDKTQEPYAEGGLDELVCIFYLSLQTGSQYSDTDSRSEHV